MSSVPEAKAQLRLEMKARRAAVPEVARRAAGQAAAAALFSPKTLDLLSRFRCFASYLNVGPEFPTDEIHYALFCAGATLCVPRFSTTQNGYVWAALRPGEPLIRGPKGIPEPVSRGMFPVAEVDVVIVPGLAFDMLGGRLGYGAGVYDRLLTRLRPGTLRVALAFDCQVQKAPLPQEPHDLPMDYIVTESHWIDCRLARRSGRERHV